MKKLLTTILLISTTAAMAAPTNVITSPYIGVLVNTNNGQVVSPTNFWDANMSAIATGVINTISNEPGGVSIKGPFTTDNLNLGTDGFTPGVFTDGQGNLAAVSFILYSDPYNQNVGTQFYTNAIVSERLWNGQITNLLWTDAAGDLFGNFVNLTPPNVVVNADVNVNGFGLTNSGLVSINSQNIMSGPPALQVIDAAGNEMGYITCNIGNAALVMYGQLLGQSLSIRARHDDGDDGGDITTNAEVANISGSVSFDSGGIRSDGSGNLSVNSLNTGSLSIGSLSATNMTTTTLFSTTNMCYVSEMATTSPSSWPAKPNWTGAAAIVNSNGYVYILSSPSGGHNWTATNLIAHP